MTKQEFLKKVTDSFERIVKVIPERFIFELICDASARLEREPLQRAYLIVNAILMESLTPDKYAKVLQDIAELEKTANEEYGINKVSN